MVNVIHVTWSNPVRRRDISSHKLGKGKGVYQVYASHPVYGPNQLVYIGKADGKDGFAGRFSDPKYWPDDEYWGEVQLRLGKVEFDSECDGTFIDGNDKVKITGSMLINAHWLAGNSQEINLLKNDEIFMNVHILNWGTRGALLPEVSGRTLTSLYD